MGYSCLFHDNYTAFLPVVPVRFEHCAFPESSSSSKYISVGRRSKEGEGTKVCNPIREITPLNSFRLILKFKNFGVCKLEI